MKETCKRRQCSLNSLHRKGPVCINGSWDLAATGLPDLIFGCPLSSSWHLTVLSVASSCSVLTCLFLLCALCLGSSAPGSFSSLAFLIKCSFLVVGSNSKLPCWLHSRFRIIFTVLLEEGKSSWGESLSLPTPFALSRLTPWSEHSADICWMEKYIFTTSNLNHCYFNVLRNRHLFFWSSAWQYLIDYCSA